MWNIISLAPPFAGGANEAPRHAMFVRDSRRLPGPRACSVRLHRLRVYIRKCWFSIYGCSCVQQVFYVFLLTGLHTCSYCIFNVHVSSIADSIDVLHLFPDYFQTSWAQHDMKTAQLVVWDIFPIQDGENSTSWGRVVSPSYARINGFLS